MPATSETNVDSLRRAIRQLVEGVDRGTPHHPCDVRFGRDVVAVLAEAESQLR